MYRATTLTVLLAALATSAIAQTHKCSDFRFLRDYDVAYRYTHHFDIDRKHWASGNVNLGRSPATITDEGTRLMFCIGAWEKSQADQCDQPAEPGQNVREKIEQAKFTELGTKVFTACGEQSKEMATVWSMTPAYCHSPKTAVEIRLCVDPVTAYRHAFAIHAKLSPKGSRAYLNAELSLINALDAAKQIRETQQRYREFLHHLPAAADLRLATEAADGSLALAYLNRDQELYTNAADTLLAIAKRWQMDEEKDATTARSLNEAGMISGWLGKWQLALTLREQEARISNLLGEWFHDPRVYGYMADAYQHLGQHKEAAAFYERCITERLRVAASFAHQPEYAYAIRKDALELYDRWSLTLKALGEQKQNTLVLDTQSKLQRVVDQERKLYDHLATWKW